MYDKCMFMKCIWNGNVFKLIVKDESKYFILGFYVVGFRKFL